MLLASTIFGTGVALIVLIFLILIVVKLFGGGLDPAGIALVWKVVYVLFIVFSIIVVLWLLRDVLGYWPGDFRGVP